MGLFGLFKGKSRKGVFIDEGQRAIVIKHPLKNDVLKIDTELEVKEGYDLVACYYNSVCDCLPSGSYHFTEPSMPKLFKHIKYKKTKKGKVPLKYVTADIYFVSKEVCPGVTFQSAKFKSLHACKKVKIKLAGTFDVKVTNPHKFVAAMLMDYSTFDEAKAKKEISAYVGYAIAGLADKAIYSVEEFNQRSEALMTKLNEVVEKELKTLGLQISNLQITEVILPKNLTVGENAIEKNDNRLDDIFTTVYGSPISNVSEQKAESENPVLAGGIKLETAKAGDNSTSGGVINLGFGGSQEPGNNIISVNNFGKGPEVKQPITEERNSTLDEYEKATKSFNEDFAQRKQQNLVFIDETEKVQTPEPPQEKKENDLMLGRTAVGTIGPLGKIDIADDFVQKNRKIELNALKESIEPKQEIKRPKVAKAPAIKPEAKKVGANTISSGDKKCKSCGTVVDPNVKFCSKCGKSTLSVRYCKACGEKNNDDAIVCAFCGSRL